MSDKLECESCGNEFEKPGTRGRPPKNCPTCRELPDVAAAKSRRIVDNLEMMLRSRGTHIQQNRGKHD